MEVALCLLFVLTLTCADATSLTEFKRANSLLAADLYKEVIKTNESNVLVSPLSIETILALTQSAAKGKTGEEIRSSLHLPSTDAETRSTFKQILPTLKGNGHFYLHTANKIYFMKNYPIKEEFKQVAREVYAADLENVDFARGEQAANTINKWVEQQTENKIRNLINSNSLDSRTVAILINALHFNGKWNSPFNTYFTKKSDFYRSANDVIKVDTMHEYNEEYDFYDSKELNAKFLSLPFLGENVAMVIALPNEKDGLANLEKHADKVFAQHSFQQTPLNISIPKFRIESSVDLKAILENLGVKQAFRPSEADFSGAIDTKNKVYISKVVQKTFIDVDEEGAEAAAITYAGWHYLSAPPDAWHQFIADHPFIFYIHIDDLILFAGRVVTIGQ